MLTKTFAPFTGLNKTLQGNWHLLKENNTSIRDFSNITGVNSNFTLLILRFACEMCLNRLITVKFLSFKALNVRFYCFIWGC